MDSKKGATAGDPRERGEESGRRPDDVILRIRAVADITGLGTSTIWKVIGEEDSEFPRPVRLGKRAVGIWKSELMSWLESRPRAPDGSSERARPTSHRYASQSKGAHSAVPPWQLHHPSWLQPQVATDPGGKDRTPGTPATDSKVSYRRDLCSSSR